MDHGETVGVVEAAAGASGVAGEAVASEAAGPSAVPLVAATDLSTPTVGVVEAAAVAVGHSTAMVEAKEAVTDPVVAAAAAAVATSDLDHPCLGFNLALEFI